MLPRGRKVSRPITAGPGVSSGQPPRRQTRLQQIALASSRDRRFVARRLAADWGVKHEAVPTALVNPPGLPKTNT